MSKNSISNLDLLLTYLKKINKDWFISSIKEIPSYAVIGYNIEYPEAGNPSLIEFDIGGMKSDKGEMQRLPSGVGENNTEALYNVYKVQTGLKKTLLPKAKGVSEPLGILPKTFAYNEEVQGTIERNLSDVMMGILYKEILTENIPEIIIFQGPLFPKLIGRLGYRHLKKEITIAGITFKNEWIPPISSENYDLMNALNSELQKKGMDKLRIDGINEWEISDVPVSNGIEETFKSWVLETKRMKILLEIFCSFPYPRMWLEKLCKLIEIFRFPGVIMERGQPILLPFLMACSYDICRYPSFFVREGLKYQNLLLLFEEDVQEMYKVGWGPIKVGALRTMWYFKMLSDGKELFVGDRPISNGKRYRAEKLENWIKNEKEKGEWKIDMWEKIILKNGTLFSSQ